MNKIALIGGGLLIWQACAPAHTEKSPEPDQESGFIHAVYFYLHDSLPASQKDDYLKVLDTLATIPDIKHAWYGPPAHTPRKVVDNSYDYAFITLFENKSAHDAYQKHPIHVGFKKRYSHLIQDVKIYDNYFGDHR